jgi:deferrochelatase/peroxidase EfeB
MSDFESRRRFLKGAGLVAVASTGIATCVGTAALAEAAAAAPRRLPSGRGVEDFYGAHQAGIVTPQQRYSYFAAFDLTTGKREDVVSVLKAWTDAAARMARGQAVASAAAVVSAPGPKQGQTDEYGADQAAASSADSGETEGLSAERLTITFGFGASLFSKDGNDRFGLAARRPEALIDLPKFAGDQLVDAQTGGDISVQACADDPQVAFHAVRQLARLADGVVQIRWVQAGFLPNTAKGETPRNLTGFKDGTHNPPVTDPSAMARYVWVSDEGPGWMRGGSYTVFRRIRIALEHWDRMSVSFQEQTMGRTKVLGAPLGKTKEFDQADFSASDKDGNLVIPEHSHLRLASAVNTGTEILRRGYSYNEGVSFVAERWPPWRQGLEYDAGLFFVCYQRDPRTGFVKLFERMAKLDMLNQFVTHVGGGLFACPGGVAPSEYIGQRLFT